MPKTIHIRLPFPPSPSDIHRFRNFGENLFREIQLKDLGVLSDIDTATDHITISEVKPRNIGAVFSIVKKQLKNHFFESTAVVSNE